MTDSPLEKRPSSGNQPAARPAAEADVRASDADRDRVADILREALAEGRLDAQEHSERLDALYEAKTMGQLEPLVRDLPQTGTRPAPAPAPESGRAPQPADVAVAVFSGATRKGRWRVPGRVKAFACFGGVDIDLTRAVFAQREVVIHAVVIFGGVDVRVPENVTLHGRGTGIFGGFDVRSTESPDPGAPVVTVKGLALFGGVSARLKRGKRVRDFHDQD
ncbi:DUF1707 SHOCT-like domain-containing protein [Streptomyces sp. TR06-5]|uniref:DUF1707 SHOCT-like domain-containing protein n=1 Tax=unclassified Streptomyces TaxID=2593676 RepID=UPI0039A39B8F